jgi:hypothetical protein
MSENVVKNVWVEVKGKVSVRKGTREGWYEMKVEGKKGGEDVVVKMVGKKVREFYSERMEDGLLMDDVG